MRAAQVARELTEKDALTAHVREELGLSEVHAANPLQAALASGLTFSVAAAIPLLAAVLAPVRDRSDLADIVAEASHQVLEVHAEGEGRLAQVLDLMYLGSWVSCYLALDNDVDPGPIDAINQQIGRAHV